MHTSRTLGICLLLCSLVAITTRAEIHSPTPKPPPSASNASPTDGERVFKQTCSRCHQAPQGFPPQISGTIVRHMRVRASLSEKDERTLLKFLNP